MKLYRYLVLFFIIITIFTFIYPIKTHAENINNDLTPNNESVITENLNYKESIPDEAELSSKDVFDEAKNINTLTSFVVSIIIPTILLLVFGKEFPKKYVPVFSFVFFLIIFAYNIIIHIFNDANIAGTIYITFLFIILSLVWIKIYNKYISINVSDNSTSTTPNPKKKAEKYIKTKIKKCHNSIESIQLYHYNETHLEKSTEYWFEYICGSSKPHIEINALLGMKLTIDNDTFNEVMSVINLYYNYTEGEVTNYNSSETYITLLQEAIKTSSTRIKQQLELIRSKDEVSVINCCYARILAIYCSILASLSKEGTFVGFGNNALGLESDIEQELFTLKRTGLLGAVLLKRYPYGFYYNRKSDKSGRTYCSFVCEGRDDNYLVLIAFKMKNGAIAPDFSVSNALSKIETELTKILEKEAI